MVKLNWMAMTITIVFLAFSSRNAHTHMNERKAAAISSYMWVASVLSSSIMAIAIFSVNLWMWMMIKKEKKLEMASAWKWKYLYNKRVLDYVQKYVHCIPCDIVVCALFVDFSHLIFLFQCAFYDEHNVKNEMNIQFYMNEGIAHKKKCGIQKQKTHRMEHRKIINGSKKRSIFCCLYPAADDELERFECCLTGILDGRLLYIDSCQVSYMTFI